MSRSKTPEEIKQALLIQEQARLAEKEAKEKARAAQEAEEAAKKHRIKNKDDSNIESDETQAKPLQTLDWQKIIAAYKDQFDLEAGPDGTLAFPDKKSATAFFKEQAALCLKFFCVLLPEKKDFEFSCGDGQLYSGSLAEIQEKLKTALENASPENKINIEEGLKEVQYYMKTNPTQDARLAMKNLARPAEQEQDDAYQSPSPLSTTNKPKGF